MDNRKFRSIGTLADIVILTISFLVLVWTKPASLRLYLPSHMPFFIALVIMWIGVSILNGKLNYSRLLNYSTLFYRVLSSNFIAISITALVMYSLRLYDYSRTIVLGTALLATFFELTLGMILMAYKKAVIQYEKKPSEYDMVNGLNGNGAHKDHQCAVNPGIAKAIEKECGAEMAAEILKLVCCNFSESMAVLSTTTPFNVSNLAKDKYNYIINLHKINDIKKPDSFFDEVNNKLDMKGYFFCIVETKDQRKQRLLKKYPPVLNYIYYFFDFIVKRILPKLKFTHGLYMILTRGENMVLSRAETLGRISRAGFMIHKESFIGNLLCIEAKKVNNPVPVNETVYGPLIALSRVGKFGDPIKVYKLRTMHPYSEFIQNYVYMLHDLQGGGKFRNDFRITSWGAICRRIWLDELPMLMNFLRGDMKLIGVRPLSKQYFELYRKDVQERRIRYKPGLIPPFYVDMPTDLEAIQQSEIKYLDAYDKNPVYTDLMYFAKSGWNILFKKARSN